MNARYAKLQDLRDALRDTADRVAALLTLDTREPVLAPVARPAVFARRFAFAAALAGAVSLAGAAHAYDRGNWTPESYWADGKLVDVQLQVDGQAAPLYFSPRGDQRRYFEAFAGRNYSVLLRNTTGRRIGVLLTVDGLNVVNGEITRQSADEPMYVLGPWETATIRGWRTSLDEVRRFVFVDERRSYAERTGQANRDMGWIRVLAFREKQQVKFWSPNERRKPDVPWFGDARDRAQEAPQAGSDLLGKSNEAPRAAAPAPTVQRMDGGAAEKQMAQRDEAGSAPGTGWGDRRTDRVNYVDFTAERGATDLIVFRYEYASGLAALGIFPNHDRDRVRDRDRGGLVGFARPPRW